MRTRMSCIGSRLEKHGVSFNKSLLKRIGYTFSTSAPTKPPNSETEIYFKPQEFTIRTMFGICCVNLMYWSSLIANSYFFQGMVVQGIDLAGDPTWGYIGCAGTGALIYFTKYFSGSAVLKSYISADGKRIGFQVHDVLGRPGKKYEVAKGNVRFARESQDKELRDEMVYSDAQLKTTTTDQNKKGSQDTSTLSKPVTKIFDTSLIPLRLQGLEGRNLLIDKSALHQHDGKLLSLLLTADEHKLQSKEDRNKWRKTVIQSGKKRRT